MDAAEVRLWAEIDVLLDACEEQDQEQHRSVGPGDDGTRLPPELRSVQARNIHPQRGR